MKKSRIELMESEPVRTAILRLALPTMLAMGIQLIYNLTDTYFIGQTGDPTLVAGISFASPIFMLIHTIGNIFAIGSASYISRKLGEHDYEEAKRACSVAVYSAVILGLVITAAVVLFISPLMNMLGASPTIYKPTRDYLMIIGASSVILILQVVLAGLIRSEGATGKAMVGMIIGIVLNIILDPIFILVFNMGTAGAAWATVIGALAGLIYFAVHLLSPGTMLSILPKDFKPTKTIYFETLKIGLPSALSSLVMTISSILVNRLIIGYGDFVVAGNGVQMRVSSMFFLFILGLSQGYQPFAGYNYGARKFDRLLSGYKTTLLYSTILALIFTPMFFFFARDMISLFINDPQTIEAGAKMNRAFIIAVPFIGIQFTQMVTFQATGKALKAMTISLGRQCLLYIPLLFTLNHFFGFDGFIYAQPIADILTTGLALAFSASFIKELRKLHSETPEQETVKTEA